MRTRNQVDLPADWIERLAPGPYATVRAQREAALARLGERVSYRQLCRYVQAGSAPPRFARRVQAALQDTPDPRETQVAAATDTLHAVLRYIDGARRGFPDLSQKEVSVLHTRMDEMVRTLLASLDTHAAASDLLLGRQSVDDALKQHVRARGHIAAGRATYQPFVVFPGLLTTPAELHDLQTGRNVPPRASFDPPKKVLPDA